MPTPLLSTKLFVPILRETVVKRQRLVDLLKKGFASKLILVSAPAGFGKTTLLISWINQTKVPTAWLSLDGSDNAPTRFLAYIIAALQTVIPGIGETILETLQSPQADFSESTLISLINEIATSDTGDFVLVLDDYHRLASLAIHEITSFLVENLPKKMHVVIASRADPNLPIPRLRGSGDLIEIRQEDLRFTIEEVTEFLNRIMGLSLTYEDISALINRTEGWIAGLQMAALSMSGKEDLSRYIQDLTGTDRYILDYLIEEVLEQQTKEMQNFLLQTSIVAKLCAPLCNTITGVKNTQEILEQFERNNLFILPLDDERVWYRYHQLFADLLQKLLNQKQPKHIHELHSRAGKWYERNGFTSEAIQHYINANDFERAADLVDQIAEDILMRSELSTLLEWIEAIPDQILRQRPLLSLHYANILLMYGHPLEKIESYIENAETTSDQYTGHIAALRAFMAVIQRDVPRAAELADLAIKNLPESDRFARITSIWVKSASSMISGKFEEGQLTLEEVAKQSQAVGNIMISTIVMCNRAQLFIINGELQKAQKLFERTLDLAKDRDGSFLPIAGEALFGMAELFYEWHRFDDAMEYLEEGFKLTQKWGSIASVEGLLTKARILRAQGELDAAHGILLEARQLALQSEASELDDYLVEAHLAQNWLELGDINAAFRWVQDRGLAEWSEESDKFLIDKIMAELDQVTEYSFISQHRRRSFEFFSLVRVLMSQGQTEEALTILERLLEFSQSRKLFGREIQLQILIALVHNARSDNRLALDSLKRALSLAEPEEYMRVFLDEGLPMQDLLKQAAEEKILPAYVNRLLQGFTEKGQTQKQSLVDPLSEREMEILRLLPTSLTAPEIAEHLFVAESTIRTHIKHIYAKLNVNRRFDAVEQAKDLGLL
ncbi:tetratricopeptide repeat protein [Chloroflexota bacterium]